MEDTTKLLELLGTQDMGQPYAEQMINLGKENDLGDQTDHLTCYVVKSYLERDDMEDFERDLDYAIDSLKRMKNAI